MACLIAIDGPAKGQYFALGTHKLVLVGRDDRCTFQILDPQISRQHLQIRQLDSDSSHCAIDFRSANGVVINDRKIDAETPLRHDDQIDIGETTLVYSKVDYADAVSAMEAMKRRGESNRSTMVFRSNE